MFIRWTKYGGARAKIRTLPSRPFKKDYDKVTRVAFIIAAYIKKHGTSKSHMRLYPPGPRFDYPVWAETRRGNWIDKSFQEHGLLEAMAAWTAWYFSTKSRHPSLGGYLSREDIGTWESKMPELIGYETCENIIKDYMIEALPWTTTKTVVAGELDDLLNVMVGESYTFGIYLDYFGAHRDRPTEKFNGKTWVWEIVGMVLIRVDPNTIETDMRRKITDIASLFIANHTVGGQVLKAEVVDIGLPEAGAVNDIPFYWCPFTVHVWDRV
jgi:hypothetical protein